MFLPPDPPTWSEIRKQTVRQVRSSQVDDRIFEAVQKPFETAIRSQAVLLTRAERDRLLKAVMKEVLGEMLAKLDGAK